MLHLSRRALFAASAFALFPFAAAYAGCSATGDDNSFNGTQTGATGGTSGQGGSGGEIGFDGGTGSGGGKQGGVPQTCLEAIDQQSYIGCEYWPTVTSNAGLYAGFEFAIVAANPTGSDAVVTVTRGASQIAQVTVAPGQLQTIKLPWVDELKGADPLGNGSGYQSILAPGAAYKVSSSVPITLYQFNPLDFQLASAPSDCPLTAELGGCYSFTNDASLLLPKTALRESYYVMSYPTLHIGFGPTWVDLPGFVAVTATEDGTTVNVTSSAYVRVGTGVSALAPGGQGSYSLNAGDVLLLQSGIMQASETPQPGIPCETDPNSGITQCPSPPQYDLTGTRIDATKPVSVIGGHDCTFIPFNRYACDHIEESLFPIETLGQDLIVTAPRTVASIGSSTAKPDNMFIRVLSAADANTITFDPPVASPVTLNAGEWTQIGPITADVRVQASNKIMVGQYMVGENFSGQSAGAGDPALSIAIPTEQYRVEYTFLAPSTYTNNFVNVVAPTGANITIDGMTIPLDEFTPVGSSGLGVARHEVSGGSHAMKGDNNFGIVVYGYGSYTSYMVPGGLNLETITIVPD